MQETSQQHNLKLLAHGSSFSGPARLEEPLAKNDAGSGPVDEGYSSLPQNQANESALQQAESLSIQEGFLPGSVEELTGQFERIVDIDDDEDDENSQYRDTGDHIYVPVPIGAELWKSKPVSGDTPVANEEEAEITSDTEEVHRAAHRSGSAKWGLMPMIEKILGGEKKSKRDKSGEKTHKHKRKLKFKWNNQVGSQGKSSSRTLVSGSVGSLKAESYLLQESWSQERACISDEAPDFGTVSEAKFSLANQKLFEQKYVELGKQIGTGGHSTVKLAERVSDGRVVVCKYIQHSSVWNWYYSPQTKRKIPLEIHLMQKMTNQGYPGIIEYIEHFEMNGNYIIIMEHLGEGWTDLYDYIETYGPVIEDHSREIFTRIMQTIEFMHSMGYAHNDIKDENILINSKTREIKLIDFGSMTQLIPGQKITLFYGTKKFSSPEALFGDPYDPAAQEVWCLGTLLYVLLFKMDPFKDDKEILRLDIWGRIERLRACGRQGGGADISDRARDLLVALLNKDSKRRIKCDDILDFPFFKSVV